MQFFKTKAGAVVCAGGIATGLFIVFGLQCAATGMENGATIWFSSAALAALGTIVVTIAVFFHDDRTTSGWQKTDRRAMPAMVLCADDMPPAPLSAPITVADLPPDDSAFDAGLAALLRGND